jgi:hypothetical protein
MDRENDILNILRVELRCSAFVLCGEPGLWHKLTIARNSVIFQGIKEINGIAY